MRRIFPFLMLILFIGGCLLAQEKTERERTALYNLIERADAGDAKAMFDLARLYDMGYDSIPVDSVRSIELYLNSAEKGYAPAMNYVGFRYYSGSGVKKDIDSAFYWIRAAADKGDITAAANLGFLLTESEFFPHDENEARKWITIAAEGGVREAQYKLIEIMDSEWKEISGDSALMMGMKYYLGKAPILGVELIKKAAAQKNHQALAILGDAYSKGIGVPYDHQKSIEYFYLAAQEGNPSAQFIIGEMLEIFPESLPFTEEKDSGALEDLSTPFYWYEKAAENGVTDAESAYRLLYSYPTQ